MKPLLACFFCAFVLQTAAGAHTLDQYLQVAQIALTPGGVRVELRLVPGAQIADRIFALIDLDDDGQISSAEEQAYALRVLQDVALDADGRRAALALTGVQFPSRDEMNEGVGAIRLALAAEAAFGVAGEHQLSFRNDHLPELSVYLANVLVPAIDAIKISGQQRDVLQRRIRLDIRVATAGARAWPHWTGMALFGLCLGLLVPQWKRLRGFFRRLNLVILRWRTGRGNGNVVARGDEKNANTVTINIK
jgi:hypothetical protein